MSPSRRDFVIQVLRQMKLPYLWGGKGFSEVEALRLGLPAPKYDGRDCSGTAAFAYWRAGGPDLRAVCNAQYMLEKLSAPSMVRSGTLLLFGTQATAETPAHADHVMTYLEPGILVGAEGGGPQTVSIDAALVVGAKVWAEPMKGYMESRFLGYREFPLDD